MARLRNGPYAIMITIAIVVMFAAFVRLLVEDYFSATMRIGAVAVGVSVLIVYAKWAWIAFRFKPPPQTTVDYLALSVALKWLGTIGLSVWWAIIRFAEYPEWMVKSNVTGVFVVLLIIAGVLALIAPSVSNEGHITRRATLRIAIAFGLAVSLFLVTTFYFYGADDVARFLEHVL